MDKLFYSFIFIIAMALINCNNSFAQGKKPGLLIGGNIIYNISKGSLANDYRNGPGGEVMAGVGYGKTYLVGTLGYLYLMDRGSAETSNITYKPIKLGLRQFIIRKNLFINADAGTATIKYKGKNTPAKAFTYGYGAGIKLLGIEAALYRNSWKNPDKPGFSNSLQYKFGWNFTL